MSSIDVLRYIVDQNPRMKGMTSYSYVVVWNCMVLLLKCEHNFKKWKIHSIFYISSAIYVCRSIVKHNESIYGSDFYQDGTILHQRKRKSNGSFHSEHEKSIKAAESYFILSSLSIASLLSSVSSKKWSTCFKLDCHRWLHWF